MKVYIGLLLFIAIVAFINKKTNLSPKYFLWISFMAMTLVLGLRGSTVGEDTKMRSEERRVGKECRSLMESMVDIVNRQKPYTWHIIS